jgi:phenol 2-monooxygenase
MDGDSTGQIWGVVDFVPETNFPDFRNRAILMTPGGTCLLIPREANKIRIYVQLDHRPQYAENKKSSNWNNVGRDEILDVNMRL